LYYAAATVKSNTLASFLVFIILIYIKTYSLFGISLIPDYHAFFRQLRSDRRKAAEKFAGRRCEGDANQALMFLITDFTILLLPGRSIYHVRFALKDITFYLQIQHNHL
jgi:hypothetical protein